jgi:hypothetical protein
MVLETFALGAATAATHAMQAENIAPATARGRVKTDERNGSRGLPNVLVTNGMDVVQTDVDGFYSLPLPDEAIISIIKPTGYAVDTAARTLLPRFYHIYQPNGSPAEISLSSPRIAPTSKRVHAIDFVLTPQNEPTAFDVMLLADPQPANDEEVDFIRDDVVPRLMDIDAAFGVTLGDIVGDNLSLIPRICDLIGQVGRPWYNVCGNHDLNYEAPNNHYARETFKSYFGPSHYAFEYGGALFIVLDNVVYEGASATEPNVPGSYRDAIDPIQLKFVSNILLHIPKTQLIVIGMHIPLKANADESGRDQAVDDCAELLAIIGDRPCISFSGHTHMAAHKYIHYSGDDSIPLIHHHQVLSAVCGSWWSGPRDDRGIPNAMGCDGAPRGFYVLSVNGAQYSTRFMPAGANSDRAIRTILVERRDPSAPKANIKRPLGHRLSAKVARATDIIVNFFDGGPRSSVVAIVDGELGMALNRSPIIDPFVEFAFERDHDNIKPWVAAEMSEHVWTGRLPETLSAGLHRIQITAIDEFDRVARETLIVEIENEPEKVVSRL